MRYRTGTCCRIGAKVMAGVVLLSFGMAGACGEETNVFGVAQPISASLMGAFYDLKQTQKHMPTHVSPSLYTKIIDAYLARDWDERVLSPYFQMSTTLYTTQIFIPNMNADAAPKAFHADRTVGPSLWVVHYKGQVSPPAPGTYRFWGCADDALAVAVNGKTVLVACRHDMALPHVTWRSTESPGAQAADDPLIAGDWMTIGPNQIVDLDVLLGERPGGLFNAFLLVEKQGESYPVDGRGHRIFPIFQLAQYQTPMINDLGKEPNFATGYPPWIGYQ